MALRFAFNSIARQPVVRSTMAVRSFSVDGFVNDAFAAAGIGSSGSADVEALKKHRIETMDILESLEASDFSEMGVSVGGRIAIRNAIQERQVANEVPITRSLSFKKTDRARSM